MSDPELSKTAFERTLLMEERSKMLKQIQRRGVNHRLAELNGPTAEDAATRLTTVCQFFLLKKQPTKNIGFIVN